MAFKKEDTTQKVVTIIAKKLSMSPESVKLESTLKDLGADSIDLTEIVMGLEDAFGVEIKDEEAESLETVSDAVDLLHEKRTK